MKTAAHQRRKIDALDVQNKKQKKTKKKKKKKQYVLCCTRGDSEGAIVFAAAAVDDADIVVDVTLNAAVAFADSDRLGFSGSLGSKLEPAICSTVNMWFSDSRFSRLFKRSTTGDVAVSARVAEFDVCEFDRNRTGESSDIWSRTKATKNRTPRQRPAVDITRYVKSNRDRKESKRKRTK
jgi:hypothetical protein